jgi:hypothetical protein
MMRQAWLLLLAGILLSCITTSEPYHHSRADYWAFRAGMGRLPEPNYLPFVAHRGTLPDRTEGFVFCRWADEAFPLRYHVEPPIIPDDIQDEFNPRSPEEYVGAVHRAFDRFRELIGRPVRFAQAADPAEADLRVVLKASNHFEGSFELGGMLPGGNPCRIVGPGPTPETVAIEFEVDEADVFVVDEMGLLTPGQVERIALHEIGHVLGALGQHSPLRGDVMFRAADDRFWVERFSEHDRNTFRALYRIPPGQIYARVGQSTPRLTPEARVRPPRLDRPIQDERFGLDVRLPLGWQAIQTPRGWFAVDGLTWDYDASVQVIFMHGTIGEYLARYGLSYLSQGELVGSEWLEIDGRPLVRAVMESEGRTEDVVVLDWAPGEVILVMADSRTDDYAAYQPWFRQVLLALEPLREGTSTDVGGGPPP